jgi:hypothetical protein
MYEIERLRSLVPDRLRNIIKIDRAKDVNLKLLLTRRIDRSMYLIHIDLRSWQSLDVDLRNLLFWHELARISNGSIYSNRSIYLAIAAGLGIGLVDLPTHNIGILVAALLIAGLAGFKLYQNQVGERHLRQLATADRDAIELAVEFGYDRHQARKLLGSAIYQAQTKLAGDRSTRSAARLQVLNLVGL